MVEWFKNKIRILLFPEMLMREQMLDDKVNQRVAAALLQMDPFEPLMRMYTGAFGDVYERPEDMVDEVSHKRMLMWAYALVDDPSFIFFIQWILNTEGNNFIRFVEPTPEKLLFSRAMVAAPLLIRREVRRMANVWEKYLEDQRPVDFDEHSSVEADE